ncbi:restriction endonuclease subunit S [bacterium]|nr:restriction endonuclease subunit S [bacterium]
MSKTQMIKIQKDFQHSINIAYDLHDDKKIKNFIATNEAIDLFEEFFSSTYDTSTKRAHILIGAYGKGKSHIVLEILSLLLEKDKSLFETFLSKLKIKNPGLYEDAINYIKSDKKILPIIISGSSTSLSQSFLAALYQTLKQHDFTDLMPDTNFTAAINTIEKWKNKYPKTYKEFSSHLNIKVSDYIERLQNYDSEIYSNFIELYPQLTSGSEFNPFTGFDIVELYEKVNEKLIASGKGYSGLFVVYDEFSKYLESSISKASINDIKLLQDFAEKCCRSGKKQLHLMLISHKEISNYIDTLPKEKVDGWKGVSERFSHIVMHSDYSQVYEIMTCAIKKDTKLWNDFLANKSNNNFFQDITGTNIFKKIFSNSTKEDIKNIVEGCYPLHPVTTYILPRFSEKIAQNERTMFTFLSAEEKNTLASFIKDSADIINTKINFLTPDLLFNYFENQMRSEPYTSPIKAIYNTAKKILANLDSKSIESKLVKTLALVYCLNQFERLAPTNELLLRIYSDAGYKIDEISKAIDNLLTKESFLYLRRSTNYLQLKETTGIDIESSISNMIEKRKNKITDVEIINELNLEKYLYPVEYNTNNEMTRYFEFRFITEEELNDAPSVNSFEMKTAADGIVLGILAKQENYSKIEKYILSKSKVANLTVFVLPTNQESISNDLRRIDAIKFLKSENAHDTILCDEYELIEQDLNEIITNFIRSYTHPEFGRSSYFAKGAKKQLFRKASFTHLLSQLCEDVYNLTPILNNEPLNKNELTGAARKSRNILIDAILNSPYSDLGISGGQELSFKRSSLLVTGIINDDSKKAKYFDTESDNLANNYQTLFSVINQFIGRAKNDEISFESLVYQLTNKQTHFGMRTGIIPIYIAVVLSKIANNVVIKDKTSELKLNAETICSAIENPKDYFIKVVEWSKDKDIYIQKLEDKFKDYIIEEEKKSVGYTYLLNGMTNWIRELPKYSKELKNNTPKEYIDFINILKTPGIGAQEILFNKTKKIFSTTDYSNDAFHKIDEFKYYYDNAINRLEEKLIDITKKQLGKENNRDSLCNCGKKFRDNLDEHISEHRFENHAENLFKVLASCGNDENKLIKSLALSLTGINTVDWSESTIMIYERQLTEYIDTLRKYKYTNTENQSIIERTTESNSSGSYYINFVDDNGKITKRNFNKVTCSKKAGVLETELVNILNEYGQSINENEKRQVLINILEELSK